MPRHEEGLSFFNSLSGTLIVELSEPTEPIAKGLMDRKAPSSARVIAISLELEIWQEDREEPRPLTEEEWSRVALVEPVIRLRGEEGERVVEHRAPDGKRFTVRQLAAAIAETERQTRGSTEWFGGVDTHHVFFEGLDLEENGVYTINWGS